MKKLYTILLSAAVALGVSAGTQTVSLQLSKAYGLKTASETGTSISSLTLRNATLAGSFAAKETSAQRKAPAKAPTATDWTSIGEGTYLEDFLTFYSNVEANQMWKVTVETSASNPGWYRFQPYASGPLTEPLGTSDETYMYINATDPQKVIAEEFTAFDRWLISQMVTENEWGDNPDYYGTLADNVISFPVGSFAISVNNQFVLTTKNTGFKLYLPGAEVKDYAFSVSSVYCSDRDVAYCNLKSGADIATIKGIVLSGHYTIDNNEGYVAQNGQEFAATVPSISLTPTAPGLYTFLFVALDADENIVGKGQAYAMWYSTDDSDWADCGTISFNEGIYPASYSDIAEETLTGTLQESISTPGYFRIKNAYSTHSALTPIEHTTHPHYIYLNATDPEYVYIEASAIGAGTQNYGLGVIFSRGWKFLSQKTDAMAAGYGGKYDKEAKTITFPADEMYLGEEQYSNGAFYRGSSAMTFDMSGYSAINNVLSDADADVNAPVEFFNLQGVRVANPTEGQLVIRRQGTKVEKVVLK